MEEIDRAEVAGERNHVEVARASLHHHHPGDIRALKLDEEVGVAVAPYGVGSGRGRGWMALLANQVLPSRDLVLLANHIKLAWIVHPRLGIAVKVHRHA